MKRSRLKRKKGLRKRSRSPIAKLKAKAWRTFSRYIRTRDCLKTTKNPHSGKCITCGELYPFEKLDAGHYIHEIKHPMTYFHEKNAHAQCQHCNRFANKGDEYAIVLRKMYGKDILEELNALKNQHHQFQTRELEEFIAKYKEKTEQMLNGVWG